MLDGLTVVFLGVLLTLAYAWTVAEPRDRFYVFGTILIAWPVFGGLLFLFNEWMPFSLAVGGDDRDYIFLASLPADTFAEVFDFSRFDGMLAQPGYPVLLSVLNPVADPDLFLYKVVNLCFFFMLALTWYRIGFLLDSRNLGRRALLGVLMLAPLWYYFLFLLKDLVIVFLLSLFLLGMIRSWKRPSISAILLIVISAFCILLFRAGLIVQMAMVVLGAGIVRLFTQERFAVRVGWLAVILAGIGGVGLIATNREVLELFGVAADERALDQESTLEMVDYFRQRSMMNRLIFPATYFLMETAGLNPDSWREFDSVWLRGFLGIPWIIFVVPFSFLGLVWLFRIPRSPLGEKEEGGYSLGASRLMTTPWCIVLLFILTSALISWSVGDTTRWRLSDTPAFMAIAMTGWMYAARRIRWWLLVYWITGGGTLILSYYIFR